MDAITEDFNSKLTIQRAFTLFPLLPLELRLKVWDFTFTPQVFQYWSTILSPSSVISNRAGGPTCYHQFKSSCEFSRAPPIALRICHESRSYALEHYLLSFESTAVPDFLDEYSVIVPRAQYYNPEIDIVMFDVLQDIPKQIGRLNTQTISAYGAAPAFKDVRRVLLTGYDWETETGVWGSRSSGSTRMPQEQFFSDHFKNLDEILLAQRFEDPRGRSGSIWVATDQLVQKKERLQSGLANLMSQIPGWKIPDVRFVLSSDNLTEVPH